MARKSSVSSDVIVWELESDIYGLFCPYSPEVSCHLEKEYQCKRATTIALGKIDTLLQPIEVDVLKMIQYDYEGPSRRVRRTIAPAGSCVAKGVLWEWLSVSGWHSYSLSVMNEIEAAFQADVAEVDLQKLEFDLPIVVMINKGYQKNKSSGFVRQIQRRSLTVRYPGPEGEVSQTKRTDRASGPLREFCSDVKDDSLDGECPICLEPFCEDVGERCSVVMLKVCQHIYHIECLESAYKHANSIGWIQCSLCKQISGVKRGNQPAGKMTFRIDDYASLPGHPRNGTICITYDIYPGVQGPHHPNPGQPFILNGFPRTAYLPDSNEGQRVLRLLQEAWKRGLIFTVGYSPTANMDNCVVWNDVHHKTERSSSHNGYGYPDPGYLDRVTEELKSLGVVEGSF